jgi:hypothetical protein
MIRAPSKTIEMVRSRCRKYPNFYTIFKETIQTKKGLEMTKTIAFSAARQSYKSRKVLFRKTMQIQWVIF